MDQASIAAFLTIQRTRSITRAAAVLHVSQSALSQRLQLLENEIGASLFSRGKGQKIVELTAEGESFLAIAEQWMQLNEAAMSIKSNPGRVRLNIGGVDSAISHAFSAFFPRYIEENPLTDIMVHTHHSWEVYSLLQSGELDIGITNNDHHDRDILTELLFTEQYVIIRSGSRTNAGQVHPGELDAEKCVFQSFDLRFAQWYERWFPKGARVRVNTASMLVPFLRDPECWSIVPLSLAGSLAKNISLTWNALSGEPPERSCYLVTCRQKRAYNAKTVMHFSRDLVRYLQHFSFQNCPCPATNPDTADAKYRDSEGM